MEKLHVRVILEILGRPPEYIKEALTTLVLKLGAEKGVKLLSKEIHEPILAEGSKDLFTTFAEIELELESLQIYFNIMFAYMPSSIELISPEKIALTNNDLTHMSTQLAQKLHDYDALAKRMIADRDIAMAKLHEVAPYLFEQPPASAISESKPSQLPEETKKQKPVRKKKQK